MLLFGSIYFIISEHSVAFWHDRLEARLGLFGLRYPGDNNTSKLYDMYKVREHDEMIVTRLVILEVRSSCFTRCSGTQLPCSAIMKALLFPIFDATSCIILDLP